MVVHILSFFYSGRLHWLCTFAYLWKWVSCALQGHFKFHWCHAQSRVVQKTDCQSALRQPQAVAYQAQRHIGPDFWQTEHSWHLQLTESRRFSWQCDWNHHQTKHQCKVDMRIGDMHSESLCESCKKQGTKASLSWPTKCVEASFRWSRVIGDCGSRVPSGDVQYGSAANPRHFQRDWICPRHSTALNAVKMHSGFGTAI